MSKENIWARLERQTKMALEREKAKYICIKCGKEMNVVSFLMSPICLACTRKAHKKALGL